MKTRTYELVISEFAWNTSAKRVVQAWGFNGTVPGPILSAEKGDRLIIKTRNNLKESTVIHWHGIRLPASMDGTDSVQKTISPGEEFEYDFVVPDAGTFWYHAHHNETVQMERGMYGALIVTDPQDPKVDGERVLTIDDMKLTSTNDFRKGSVISRWVERHDGREGNTLLINGKENFQITLHAGQTERWRFINASSARYFRLSLGGKRFKIMATDGGLIQEPVDTDEILLVPGERVDLFVGPFSQGETFPVESLSYNRMTMVKSGRKRYAEVKVLSFEPTVFSNPVMMRTIEPLAARDTAANRVIKFSVGPSLRNGIDFLVNGSTHATDRPVKPGELQVWEIRNTSLMDHPFHLHGFFFQILGINGEAPAFISWKDTVNLPPRSTVKIAWMPDDRTGSWMYHCHILEHHEAGMMGHFEVTNSETPASTVGGHRHHMHQA